MRQLQYINNIASCKLMIVNAVFTMDLEKALSSSQHTVKSTKLLPDNISLKLERKPTFMSKVHKCLAVSKTVSI